MTTVVINNKYQAMNHAMSSLLQLLLTILFAVLLAIPEGTTFEEPLVTKVFYYYKEVTLHWVVELVLALLSAGLTLVRMGLAVTSWKLYRLEAI